MAKEIHKTGWPGGLILLMVLGVGGVLVWLFVTKSFPFPPWTAPIFLGIGFFFLKGIFVVNPNEAVILQFFGTYVGTIKTTGLRFTNPLYTSKRLSQRAVTFQSEHLKVNDLDGNPIEIATIIVWKVTDTARAVFDVDDYESFVEVQSEAALRNLATSYPYDAHDNEQVSLRGHTSVIAEHLQKEVQEKATQAGVMILDARISHLAYAPEIAQAMLQRQQAGAIISARAKIVEGAVSMVEMALERLTANNVVRLSEERKADMVANLLVVLCGERAPQPVINTSAAK